MYFFFCIELTAYNVEYGDKASSGRTSDKVLHSLAWNIDDLTHLSDEGSKIIVELHWIKELADGPMDAYLKENVPRKLCVSRERLCSMLKGVYQFRRTSATHIFVIMISTEKRTRKPYALPIQCIPYASLTDKGCRKLFDRVIQEMYNRGMKVAGTCITNCSFTS